LNPLPIVERILLTAWIGGMWGVGYLAVPVLFSMLADRHLAGELAGRMFTIVSVLGLTCGGVLLAVAIYGAGRRWRRNWRAWVLIVMLVLVSVGEFVLQPMMHELKGQGLAEGSAAAARFGVLHGISAMLYLVTSLLGLVLVGFSRRAREA